MKPKRTKKLRETTAVLTSHAPAPRRPSRYKYPHTYGTLNDLRNRFTYHAPKDDQIERYKVIRDAFLQLALVICNAAPQSRELSTALTHLDAAMMFANAAIARNESRPEGGK